MGRALVVLEALIGQIFLVTTVARLVSMYRGPVGAGARVAERSKRAEETARSETDRGDS